ncbi:uncharacterized protein LOC111005152 isoform X2 [Momordica charantia]|uniref:Uncharacterized protein LOC111005152 isoform X2 n=1 Tax=Momordica charantia TaxID=3673 RepID=A0A6J1BVR6_MOMCH|nr:uncharacterized protein LOC111005152 isoform X2 [Momordica charantia]
MSNQSRRKPNDALTMKLIVATFVGVVFGFTIGVSFPMLSLSKLNFPSSLLPTFGLPYIEGRNSGRSREPILNVQPSVKNNNRNSSRTHILNGTSEIWVPSNPRGAESLPPKIVSSESDLYARRLWGNPSEFSENFVILLFHYDGRTSEWDEFEWSKRAIHVSARKQAKWWYAKRFLHPDIVAPYDYIFIWDEDLGLDHFDADEYVKLVRKYGLEISQPGLQPSKGLTWRMTRRRDWGEIHKETDERPGWCTDPHLPPCAAFVEIMAPVFSRDAWRCVWHMLQNDLVHGWGLDFLLRRCVDPAHEKIGVIDSQWIVHQGVPSLGSQGESQNGRAPWVGVSERCRREWTMLQSRWAIAENEYLKDIKDGVVPLHAEMH